MSWKIDEENGTFTIDGQTFYVFLVDDLCPQCSGPCFLYEEYDAKFCPSSL